MDNNRFFDIDGAIVKQDDRYVVLDNSKLKNLIVSQTILNPGKSTTGHSHAGQEEVYFFVSGYGEMELDGKRFRVHPGKTVIIKDGVFHRVHAKRGPLEFVCVFDGKRYDV
jgi:mannose-6-phosphate isomerase-like protein (cupin superfamily)